LEAPFPKNKNFVVLTSENHELKKIDFLDNIINMIFQSADFLNH